MKVIATRAGYFDLRRVKEGVELKIAPGQFSAAWMQPVGEVPEAFKEEVLLKQATFEQRPSLAVLRQRADGGSAAAIQTAIAKGIEQGLSAERARHAELVKQATPPADQTAEKDAGKPAGGSKPTK